MLSDDAILVAVAKTLNQASFTTLVGGRLHKGAARPKTRHGVPDNPSATVFMESNDRDKDLGLQRALVRIRCYADALKNGQPDLKTLGSIADAAFNLLHTQGPTGTNQTTLTANLAGGRVKQAMIVSRSEGLFDLDRPEEFFASLLLEVYAAKS